ncbi:hypothetical protein F4815DRAFT_183063 [Daldinia loculata]|nr:hypothetical protein F4815DRAFT_183063 [Daldinia loculata]
MLQYHTSHFVSSLFLVYTLLSPLLARHGNVVRASLSSSIMPRYPLKYPLWLVPTATSPRAVVYGTRSCLLSQPLYEPSMLTCSSRAPIRIRPDLAIFLLLWEDVAS